ncbi:MAG: hypothetical protein ACREP6_04335 [Candidatus Binataceae bacterium]
MRVALITISAGLVALSIGCQRPAINDPPSNPVAAAHSMAAHVKPARASGSGIYGTIVADWGNKPAHAPSFECVTVLDAGGRHVVAHGVCSDEWERFKVPLSPGKYIVEVGGHWEGKGANAHYVSNQKTIEVKPGKWVKIKPARRARAS